MMVMPANNSSPRVHYMAGRYPGRIGWLVGPRARLKTSLKPWLPYALDNDAFSAWTNKTEWDVEEWRRLLLWAQASGRAPRWTLIPDVVTDRSATIAKWSEFAPEARKFGWPLAFAVQDGMEPDDVPTDADVVFVGGSSDWKWATMPMWASRFPRVHVGRVNNVERCDRCYRSGVESVDGTGWMRDPSDPRKMEALENWLIATSGTREIDVD